MLSSIFLFMSLLKASAKNNFLIWAQTLRLSQVSLPIGPASLLQASKMLSAALGKHKHSPVIWASQCVWYFSLTHALCLSDIQLPRVYRQEQPFPCHTASSVQMDTYFSHKCSVYQKGKSNQSFKTTFETDTLLLLWTEKRSLRWLPDLPGARHVPHSSRKTELLNHFRIFKTAHMERGKKELNHL